MKRYNIQVQYQTTASDHLLKADLSQQEFDWLRAHLQGVCPEVMRVDEIPDKPDNTCPAFQTCTRIDCMFDADILESQFQEGIMKICTQCREEKKQ